MTVVLLKKHLILIFFWFWRRLGTGLMWSG